MTPFYEFGERVKHTDWNILLLLIILVLQSFLVIFVVVLLVKAVPIIPELERILGVVDDVLADVKIMLPSMNGTLWDLNHILPDVKEQIRVTDAICKHTEGCLG